MIRVCAQTVVGLFHKVIHHSIREVVQPDYLYTSPYQILKLTGDSLVPSQRGGVSMAKVLKDD